MCQSRVTEQLSDVPGNLADSFCVCVCVCIFAWSSLSQFEGGILMLLYVLK